jgi:hypothetical protein
VGIDSLTPKEKEVVIGTSADSLVFGVVDCEAERQSTYRMETYSVCTVPYACPNVRRKLAAASILPANWFAETSASYCEDG